MTDHLAETKAFRYADTRILELLDKLKTKRVCGCCVGRALMFNAAVLCEKTMGSAEAVKMLEGISDTLRRNNRPTPDYEGQGMVIDDDDSVH